MIGPLLLILLTGDLPKIVTSNVDSEANVAPNMYADDTSSKCASKTREATEEAMMKVSDNLSRYANENCLCLNRAKTQTLRLG